VADVAPGMTGDPGGTPLLVVGEALVDVVRRAGGDPERHVGGSPANVALGLARLGHPVRLVTCLGRDDDGALIRAHLERDGVRLDVTELARTSTATATLDEHGSATYDFDLAWSPDPVELGDAGHVHTGSIAAALHPGAEQVHAALVAARSAGATTSYDPNLRPQIIGPADDERAGVEALVATCDVVKASDEDLRWLYPGQSADAVAQRWSTGGPALVVVTLGGEGALVWRPGSAAPQRVEPLRVEVVDTVGAGDSFMSGLLSGLSDAGLLGRGHAPALRSAADDVLLAALRRAVTTSASTCTRAGSDPPTRAQL
jgi:fructokinase